MTPRDPPEPLKLGDEKKDKFCYYHLPMNHSTRRCREIIETIQNLLEKSEIERNTDVPKSVVTMVAHNSRGSPTFPCTKSVHFSLLVLLLVFEEVLDHVEVLAWYLWIQQDSCNCMFIACHTFARITLLNMRFCY